jgi:hypothetical protein
MKKNSVGGAAGNGQEHVIFAEADIVSLFLSFLKKTQVNIYLL